MSELILYTTQDGRSQIKLRADQRTVWLTQLDMAELFDATKQNISLHLKNIFQDGELDPPAVVKDSLTTQVIMQAPCRECLHVDSCDKDDKKTRFDHNVACWQPKGSESK